MTARTLADIFAQEDQEREPVKRRAPAVYRSYMGGHCQNPDCGRDLGYIETDGGRDRHYCNNACKTAAYRKRKQEQKRAQILQYNSELREYWYNNGIRGGVLVRLQEILIHHGKAAALSATDVVLFALAAQKQAGSSQHFKLIDEVMLEGSAINFEEVELDDFKITAGVDAWSDFVSTASNECLMLVKAFLYDRQQLAERKTAARKRLAELGHTSAKA